MSKVAAWTKDRVLPISFGMLILLISGVWALAMRVSTWEALLKEATSNRWTYPMARESWLELSRMNPEIKIPNISAIRAENSHE